MPGVCRHEGDAEHSGKHRHAGEQALLGQNPRKREVNERQVGYEQTDRRHHVKDGLKSHGFRPLRPKSPRVPEQCELHHTRNFKHLALCYGGSKLCHHKPRRGINERSTEIHEKHLRAQQSKVA
jgi:hypothetical protein